MHYCFRHLYNLKSFGARIDLFTLTFLFQMHSIATLYQKDVLFLWRLKNAKELKLKDIVFFDYLELNHELIFKIFIKI